MSDGLSIVWLPTTMGVRVRSKGVCQSTFGAGVAMGSED